MKLTIPQPCQEKFEEMEPLASGRFCGTCSKAVLDFTTMSDAHLSAFFRKNNGNVCGRVRNGQLNKELQQSWLSPIQSKIPKYIAGAGLLLISTLDANANTTDTIPTRLPVIQQIPLTPVPSVVKKIKGRVVENEGHPVVGAAIQVVGSSLGTVSDEQGCFTLDVPDSLRHTCIQLQVYFIGFADQFISVSGEDPDIAVMLQPYRDALTGEVIFAGAICVKRNFWQRITSWFR